jgi:hypothetical protein
MLHHTALAGAAVAAALFVVAPALAQGVILSQPQTSGGSALISLTQGGNAFGFANRRAADNFSFALPGEITGLRFWGGPESDQASPPLRNVQGFNIRIFDASGVDGAPGAALFDRSFTLGTGVTATQVPGQTVGLLGAPMFAFSVNEPISFTFAANTRYWLSVAAVRVNPVGATDEAWQWASHAGSDTLIAQDRFDGQGFLLRTLAVRNAAFEMRGTLVPTPGAAALLAFAGAIATRRRR